MSWQQMIESNRREAAAQREDSWRLRLERVRGRLGHDGVERVSSQSLLDILEVPQRSRGAGACRRLANVMRSLGWSAIKARGLNQLGVRDQIRGYARDHRHSPLS